MDNRKEILKKLVEHPSETPELVRLLSQFGWDSTDTLIKLEMNRIVVVLQSYVDGILTKSQVEDWANAIEVRDDIELDEVSKNLIQDLANPELSAHEMNETWAKGIISEYLLS